MGKNRPEGVFVPFSGKLYVPSHDTQWSETVIQLFSSFFHSLRKFNRLHVVELHNVIQRALAYHV